MKTLQKGIAVFLACFFMTGVFAAGTAAAPAAAAPAQPATNQVLAVHNPEAATDMHAKKGKGMHTKKAHHHKCKTKKCCAHHHKQCLQHVKTHKKADHGDTLLHGENGETTAK